MTKLLSITARTNSASHIEGTTINAYSKIGKEQPGKVEVNHLTKKENSFLSAEDLKKLKIDWKELTLDFTQLGLTIVGLIEVAEPVQVGADIANGAIDFSRGHPWLGLISMASAFPVVGLLPGLALSGIRVFKCIWNGFKFLGKSVFVIAKTGITKVNAFVFTKRQRLLAYLPKTEQISECLLKTGKQVSKYVSDGIMSFTEGMKDLLIQIEKKLAKSQAVEINFPKSSNSLEDVIKNNMKVNSGYNPQNSFEARKIVDTYAKYRTTYGNMGKRPLWP